LNTIFPRLTQPDNQHRQLYVLVEFQYCKM